MVVRVEAVLSQFFANPARVYDVTGRHEVNCDFDASGQISNLSLP